MAQDDIAMPTILVTGASGALGRALALHHAGPGIRLALWGRDETRLAAVADACRAKGARVVTRSLDLAAPDPALAALQQEDAAGPVTLALLVAGMGDVRAPGARVEDPALVARMIAVNFATPAALATELAGRMAARGGGRIVLVGSAAAFHALPFATAYAGSKAGLARFADALGTGVRHYGVQVMLVSPGFLDTGAVREVPAPRRLLLPVEVAAARIARAAERGTPHLVLPWPFRLLRSVDRLLPRRLRDRLLLALTPPDRR